ncbi:hypothetical protein F4703DRAFT_1943497 [Phycomyces blakesleeanus]
MEDYSAIDCASSLCIPIPGPGGKTKAALCSEIKAIMFENGITNRSNSSIRDKIQYLHDKFRKTSNYVNGVKQRMLDDLHEDGLSEDEAIKEFERNVKFKFRYYYDLKGVMGSSPLITSSFSMSNCNGIEGAQFFALSQNPQRPPKRARRTVEPRILEIIEEPTRANHRNSDYMQQKLKYEKEFNERQLCEQMKIHQSRMDHQKAVHDDNILIENKRLEIEAKIVENNLLQTKIQYMQKLEDSGLSKEQIANHLSKML